MKKLNLLIICAIAVISSCNKQEVKQPTENIQNLGSYINSLMEQEAADFFVMISTSYSNSPYDTGSFDLNRVGLTIQAGEKSNNNVGTLVVEDVVVPWREGGFYSNQILTSPDIYLGKEITFALDGSAFPSFSVSECSPFPPNLTFSNLQDHQLNLGGIDVYWTPDATCEEDLTSYVIIYADDNEENSHYTSIAVADASGSVSIDNSTLSAFSSYDYLTIVYLRGYQKIHTVGGKSINIHFSQLSSARFWIAK